MRSQEEWFEALKSWVPQWFFNQEALNAAVFQSLAKVLAEAELDVEDMVAQTYLSEASGSYLDLHGSERGVERLEDEFDRPYGLRIANRALLTQVSLDDLRMLINQVLVNGTSQITEDFNGGKYFGRGHYMSRGEVIIATVLNAFTVVVDNQLHAPYSFLDRNYFIGDFIGTLEASESVFETIASVINDNKAFGTIFRIIERI